MNENRSLCRLENLEEFHTFSLRCRSPFAETLKPSLLFSLLPHAKTRPFVLSRKLPSLDVYTDRMLCLPPRTDTCQRQTTWTIIVTSSRQSTKIITRGSIRLEPNRSGVTNICAHNPVGLFDLTD